MRAAQQRGATPKPGLEMNIYSKDVKAETRLPRAAGP